MGTHGKMGWRMLDDRQLGHALMYAYAGVIRMARSDASDSKRWTTECQKLVDLTDPLMTVADERSLAKGIVTNRTEFEKAKGLDFHGSEDLEYMEQHLLEILSSWPNMPKDMMQQWIQWRDGKSYNTAMEIQNPYDANDQGFTWGDPGQSPAVEACMVTPDDVRIGSTQKEMDMDEALMRKRMKESDVR